MSNEIAPKLVVDAARGVVEVAAPHELPLYAATGRAYCSNAKASQRGRTDQMLGFGANEAAAFLTPVILNITGHVVKYLAEEIGKSLKTEGAPVIQAGVKSLFKRLRATISDESRAPALTADQVAEVRELVLTEARSYKLDEQKATLLAQSIADSLVTI